MKRIFSALAALLLAAALLPASAEEGAGPATPTDLCAHEHKETVYYFDAPVYSPIDAYTHAVRGRAMVEVFCSDCGTVLSASTVNDAEELKPHIFTKGKCALCGQRVVQEVVSVLEADEQDAFRFARDFTRQDLENAGDILVLRAGEFAPAVVLQPPRLAEWMDARDTLAVELVIVEERAVTVSVQAVAHSGKAYAPDGELLSMRFYEEKDADAVTVTRTNEEGETEELKASWVDGGNGGYYMAFPYLGDGLYEY